MFATFSNWPLFGGVSSGLLSEAVSVLNGAHLGLNSQLGGLLKRTHQYRSTQQCNKVGLSEASLHKEMVGIPTTDIKSLLEYTSLSDYPTVADVINNCGGVKNLQNPFSFVPNRRFSTFNRGFIQQQIKGNPSLFGLPLASFVRGVSSFQLSQLETRANTETDNAKIQAEYLEAVYQQDPEYVIRRFESGRYAVNANVRAIYQKSLELAEKLSQLQESKSRSGFGGGSTGTSGGYTLGSIFDNVTTTNFSGDSTGTKENPVHVVMHPRKGMFLRELWSLARFVIVAFLAFTFVSSAIFTQVKGSTQQMTKDFRPDVGEQKYSFDDVQGIDEAKQQVQEIVEFLKNPKKFKKLGAKLPTGALLIGPPGTGKTLLAKAIAGEADVPFFFASGSEFDEMFVGVGAARVRKLFEQARRHKPCVVFIDELDAVGGARVASAVHPYSRMTLNQLLVELDGYKELEGIVVVGATNFPESLDKALVRPGRFDNQIHILMPDVRARRNILEVHAKKVKLAPDVDLVTVARGTSGFSGADLANLINQAAIRGSSLGREAITIEDIDHARDKIIMGPERKSAVISQRNKELVAYHEGGHALVALHTPEALPIHKATIIPRGPSLGLVSYLPEQDELSWSKKQYLAHLDTAMGGRVAEELVFGPDNITHGASSDLQKATSIARSMVTKFGMSDSIGYVTYGKDDKLSPATQKLIDDEVKKILKEAHDRAQNILKSYSIEHKRLAEALLQYETLDAEEIQLVIAGNKLNRKI